jgi:hypothetical protein
MIKTTAFFMVKGLQQEVLACDYDSSPLQFVAAGMNIHPDITCSSDFEKKATL